MDRGIKEVMEIKSKVCCRDGNPLFTWQHKTRNESFAMPCRYPYRENAGYKVCNTVGLVQIRGRVTTLVRGETAGLVKKHFISVYSQEYQCLVKERQGKQHVDADLAAELASGMPR